MSSSTTTPANAGIGEDKAKAFDAKGAIGGAFTGMFVLMLVRIHGHNRVFTARKLISSAENGALGGAAQSVGGPFDKEGAIGKQFTTEGGIGGSVQNALGGTKGKSN